jgi:hypothetical protein
MSLPRQLDDQIIVSEWTGGMMKYTVDDILSMEPCAEYTRERLEKLMGGKALTPLEILRKPIPLDHKLWVGIEMLPSEKRRNFACWCALQVIHLWDAPDIVVRYLKTGDESLKAAAWTAAWAAARTAARTAAQATAQAAVWNIAWAAARAADVASWDALWDIAEAAARATQYAWDAEMKKQVAKLRRMFKKLEREEADK